MKDKECDKNASCLNDMQKQKNIAKQNLPFYNLL